MSLYKFVRLACDLLMPSLYVPYISLLTGLADTPAAAAHCFSLLKQNESSTVRTVTRFMSVQTSYVLQVSLDHFFNSLSQYRANLQQTTAPPSSIYHRTAPHNRGISPAELSGLTAVLGLVTVLAEQSEQARLALAEHPGWSCVPTALGLLACPVPTSVKVEF